MNNILLRGYLKDIKYSHTIDLTEFFLAYLLTTRKNGREDLIPIKFKKFSNIYKEDLLIEILGNVRSYSHKIDANKNKVDIYVFTYLDSPDEMPEDINNIVELEGRICKIDDEKITKDGKLNRHFILANNMYINNDLLKINNYLPITIWGKMVKENQNLKVGDLIKLSGELHSRIYKKKISDEVFEFRTAYEIFATTLEKI